MTNHLPEDIRPDGRYSVTQAADMLGINRTTLWRWIKSGKVAVSGFFKVNGRPFIKGRDITKTFNGTTW